MTSENLHKHQLQSNNADAWFDNMVSNLKYDKVLLDNDILEDGKKEVYSAMISGNQELISHLGRQSSSAYFIMNMVGKYLKELIKAKSKPNKIALELSDSKILVWAEILEDDNEMEDALILSEAKINAEYSKYGFYISSTIVENCDGLDVPEHYKNVAMS